MVYKPNLLWILHVTEIEGWKLLFFLLQMLAYITGIPENLGDYGVYLYRDVSSAEYVLAGLEGSLVGWDQNKIDWLVFEKLFGVFALLEALGGERCIDVFLGVADYLLKLWHLKAILPFGFGGVDASIFQVGYQWVWYMRCLIFDGYSHCTGMCFFNAWIQGGRNPCHRHVKITSCRDWKEMKVNREHIL